MIRRFIVLLCISLPALAHAQEAVTPRPSPVAIVSMRYKDSYLKITYSQPHKRNREIFGKLVPYRQVWRTGANEATEITINKDIILNGQALKSGTYALFTIPDKDAWTVILNSDLGLWGAYNYNPKTDVLRFTTAAHTSNTIYEPFTIVIESKNDKAEIRLLWDNVWVGFPVQFLEPKL